MNVERGLSDGYCRNPLDLEGRKKKFAPDKDKRVGMSNKNS